MSHIDGDREPLRSEEVEDILTRPPLWLIRWGITIVAVIILSFFGLAVIIKYPDSIVSSVTVTTNHPPQRVVARAQSSIEKLLIANGDTVTKYQTLAILENAANFEDIQVLKKILDTFEINNAEKFYPPAEFANLELGEINSAFLNFEKHYLDYYLLMNLKVVELQKKESTISIDEINIQLEQYLAQKRLWQQEIKLKKEEFHRYQKLFSKDIISAQEFEIKEREYLSLQKNLNVIEITISQIRESINTETSKLKNISLGFKEKNSLALSNLNHSLNMLKLSLKEWEYKYLLRSSMDGIISFQKFWGPNQIVVLGEEVFTIFPSATEKYLGRSLVPAHNLGQIKKGAPTIIKLINYPSHQFGILRGKVTDISSTPDESGNYYIYISLPNGITTNLGKSLPIKQEMLGNAEILIEDLSIAERIFYKIRGIFSQPY